VNQTRIKLLAAVTSAAMMAVVLAPVASYAQDDLRAKGDKACRHDAPRLCKNVLGQGDMVVLSCFQANKTKLSATCKKFLTEIGQLD